MAGMVLGALAIWGAFFLFGALRTRRERRRADAIAAAAAAQGLHYDAAWLLEHVPGRDTYDVLRQGRKPWAGNAVYAVDGDGWVGVFEYHFQTGMIARPRLRSLVALYVSHCALDLPPFWLHPEGMADRVAGALGGQDVDLDPHPEFSRRYRLRGPDPDALRAAFAPAVAECFESFRGCSAAGAGQEMLVWWPDVTLTPEWATWVVAQGEAILGGFLETTADPAAWEAEPFEAE